MHYTIGDDRVQIEALAESLAAALGNAYVLSVKIKGFHWNVKGIEFSQYHAFFDAIFEDIDGSIDPTAENILKLGYDSPSSLTEFLALSEVTDGAMATGTDVMSMCGELLVANEISITRLNETYAIATACNQQGVANFVSERVDMHQKWSWQLRATIGLQSGMKPGVIETNDNFINSNPSMVTEVL